ncbi:MAG TPA: D-alanyl-D-alanine carboxypeptidase family protein [Acidiferrobacterales bacterium]
MTARRVVPLLGLILLSGLTLGAAAHAGDGLHRVSFLHGHPQAAIAGIEVRAALLKDLASGEVLYERAAARRLPPASLTKIMSALVVLDGRDLFETVTVTPEAAAHPPSKIGIAEGEQYRLIDLLAAMLITSANDACLAVAMHVAGTEERFAQLMNAKAAALQLDDSHFVNACGFDHPRHYSSARDLARLAEVALDDPTFALIVRIAQLEIARLDRQRQIMLFNTNYLLSNEQVTGVKTGFTNRAGRCLIATAENSDRRLILVGLNIRDRWYSSQELLRYGFELPVVGGR